MVMPEVSRSEITSEARAILRQATVIGLLKRGHDPTPIPDNPRENLSLPLPQRFPRRPRPIFIFPQNARLRRALLGCVCKGHGAIKFPRHDRVKRRGPIETSPQFLDLPGHPIEHGHTGS
jgi:hypothetical protein